MKFEVAVYGFGSAFLGSGKSHDIDLLIVHLNSDPISCQLAIQCKNKLIENINRAHVTMPSKEEENYFQFIKISNAIYLGSVCGRQIEDEIAEHVEQKLKIIIQSIPLI